MITGNDVLFWLQEIWRDISNLSDADIPSLLARLVALFATFVVAKGVLNILWRVLYIETFSRVLEPIFALLFLPFRLPFILGRWAKQKAEDAQRHRDWKRQQGERDRQIQLEAAAREETRIRMEQQQIAEQVRLQRQRRID